MSTLKPHNAVKQCGTGNHCYHVYTGAWNGMNPPPRVCCKCGVAESSEHGPMLPWGYR